MAGSGDERDLSGYEIGHDLPESVTALRAPVGDHEGEVSDSLGQLAGEGADMGALLTCRGPASRMPTGGECVGKRASTLGSSAGLHSGQAVPAALPWMWLTAGCPSPP